MVLYKRKPVIFCRPPALPKDLSTPVWYIPQTKEWFLHYEDYLTRMDYYKSKKFVCEITGNTCLTFFDALRSELQEIEEVEKNFPEALREHILRFLQFNRISRLDQLVDKVYSVFKNDYFPGETIFIKGITHVNDQGEVESTNESVKQRGTIREKVQYGQSDNITTKYLVVRLNDNTQSIVTNDQISRDRNHFTKWLIKTFIKLSVCRSHKLGAPWVVKDKYSKKYRIPREYPEDLVQYMDSTPTGEILYERAPVSNKANITPVPESIQVLDLKPMNRDKKKFPNHYLPENIFEENDLLSEKASLAIFGIQPSKKNIVDDLQIRFDIQNPRPYLKSIKYPINAEEWNRHIINDLTQEMNDTENQDERNTYLAEINRLSSKNITAIQEALEAWVFINIYHSTLGIDTFAFDDFIYAMGWNYDQYEKHGRCELLDEIWCVVLSAVVSNEIPKKEVDDDEIFGLLINVPDKEFYEKREELETPGEEKTNGSVERNTDNESDSKSNGKLKLAEDSDRGSDSEQEEQTLKSDDDIESSEEIDSKQKDGIAVVDDEDDEDSNSNKEDTADSEENDEDDEKYDHHAYSIMNHRKIPWHDRLRKRNFKDGNWQTILLGVLSLFEHIPEYKQTIQKIFKILAPKNMPATASTALTQFYEALDIDLKFQALNIIINFLVTGSIVRKYIDDCLDASANIRRSRLDNIRDYKVQLDLAQKSNLSIHEQLSKERAGTPTLKLENGEEATPQLQKRPRLNFKVVDMTEEESALAAKDSSFAELWNRRKEALLKLDQIRKENRDFESKLTELDCQRVKLLGKDRLLNRYWWFENNGLPNLRGSAGNDDEEDEEIKHNDDEEESVNDTFLMGRLWIQGPSNNDLQIHYNTDYNTTQIFNQVHGEYERSFSANEEIAVNSIPDDKSGSDVKGKEQEVIKQMNFDNIPAAYKQTVLELYGIEFKSNEILHNNERIIDHEGALTSSAFINKLTPFQRKAIEEYPNMLVNGSDWRYYDTPQEITKLLQWLNPWGKRESILRKEILNIKDSLIASMDSRRKALWIDDIPDDETKLLAKIEKVKLQIEKLKQEANNADDVADSDGDEEENNDRKRSKRRVVSNRKRKKLEKTQDIIEHGNIQELQQLVDELTETLEQKKKDIELSRVSEWVNSSALEKYEKSLYEGGDKSKPNRSRKRPLL